ncbi:MAG: competence protein CoiA family protein [Kiritimatiellales bacterium]
MERVQLPFGIKANKLTHISEVGSGLSCECFCPACGTSLIAKKGEIQAHHFAHYNAPECTYALESALHLFAKEIIAKRKVFTVPPLYDDIPDYGICLLSKDQIINIDNVYLEHRLKRVIPDLIIEAKGRRLAIEIAITHFIDEEKFYEIASQELSTIEIDLSSFDKISFKKEDIENIVVDGLQGKRWVFNDKHRYLREKYIEERKAEERKRQEREYFLQNYKFKIKKRKSHTGSVWHVDGCYLKKRKYDTDDPSRQYYANVDSDCRRCKYFRGFRNEQTSMICLAPYYGKTKRLSAYLHSEQ